MIQTAKHTPAPWQDNGNGLIYGQVVSKEGRPRPPVFIADVCMASGDEYTAREKANAALICAAPAMLDIIARFIERAHDYLPDGEEDPEYSPEAELLHDAKQVYAKAAGAA